MVLRMGSNFSVLINFLQISHSLLSNLSKKRFVVLACARLRSIFYEEKKGVNFETSISEQHAPFSTSVPITTLIRRVPDGEKNVGKSTCNGM